MRKIATLRGEFKRPRVSPHLVVAVSDAGLWLVHGARGDQGVTVVYASEFRSIKTASSGPGGYTTWFIGCVIRGHKITLPVRVSDPSSDFLTADYKWAQATAATIAYRLLETPNSPPM